MKANKFILIIFISTAVFTSCKKEDKQPEYKTPVGYFKGTYTTGVGTPAENIFFLIRENGTLREYSSNSSVDSAAMIKREKVWVNSSNNLEIRDALYNGYVFRAVLTTPITAIAGKEGIYSLGTFQPYGSFSVTRQ